MGEKSISRVLKGRARSDRRIDCCVMLIYACVSVFHSAAVFGGVGFAYSWIASRH